MNREEAENFVYQSYLRAEKHQDYNEKDAAKRRPDLTREIIRKKAGTPAAWKRCLRLREGLRR